MARPRVVILSAGASRRLGQPKALAQLPGGQPLFRLIRAATQATGVAPIVVTGAHHGKIAEALSTTPDAAHALVCYNPNWANGRTGSLICAAELAGPHDVCVLPVDHPRIGTELLDALFEEWERKASPANGWLAPASGDPPKPGHPIVIGRDLIASLLAQKETWQGLPLSQLRAQAAPLWMLPTDDATIHENLDRPSDLEALRAIDTPR